jgi:hypothetical protein
MVTATLGSARTTHTDNPDVSVLQATVDVAVPMEPLRTTGSLGKGARSPTCTPNTVSVYAVTVRVVLAGTVKNMSGTAKDSAWYCVTYAVEEEVFDNTAWTMAGFCMVVRPFAVSADPGSWGMYAV